MRPSLVVTLFEGCPTKASAETTRFQTFTKVWEIGHTSKSLKRCAVSREISGLSSRWIFMKQHNTDQTMSEGIVQRCCVFFLPLAALKESKVRGGDDSSSSFIIHEKIALLCSSQEWVYSVCIRSRSIMMHQRQRQSANAIVKMRTWYLSFVPLISARAPKEFFFKLLKNSKELLFGSNI